MSTDEKEEEPEAPAISVISLLNNFLGDSFVVMPYAFANAGLMIAFAMSALVHLMSLAGLYFMSVVSVEVAKNDNDADQEQDHHSILSFRRVSEALIPRMRVPIDLIVIAYCIGCGLCALKVTMEECMHFIDQFNKYSKWDVPWYINNKPLIVSLLVLLMAPFSSMRKLAESDTVDFISLGGVFYLIGLALYNFFKKYGWSLGQIERIWTPPKLDVIECFSIFVYASTCHHTVRIFLLAIHFVVFHVLQTGQAENHAVSDGPEWMRYAIRGHHIYHLWCCLVRSLREGCCLACLHGI